MAGIACNQRPESYEFSLYPIMEEEIIFNVRIMKGNVQRLKHNITGGKRIY